MPEIRGKYFEEFHLLKHDVLDDITTQQSSLSILEKFLNKGKTLTNSQINNVKKSLENCNKNWKEILRKYC